MSNSRVAVIFDNRVRAETTGTYCLRALRQLASVEHFLPTDLEQIPRAGFDLYLFVDDGLWYAIPEDLRPSAYWAIDTHMDFDWALSQSRIVDHAFAAQQDGAGELREAGLEAIWLPLACDPDVHRPHPVEKQWDVAFVGHVPLGIRSQLVWLVQQHFPNSFIGLRYFDEYAQTLSAARVGFNRSIKNDVNMRVFETLGCGTLLVTNDLSANGQDELFTPDQHLVVYDRPEELLDKLRFYLDRETTRQRIAGTGRAEVLSRHTYRHRMQTILKAVAARPKVFPVTASTGDVPPAKFETVEFSEHAGQLAGDTPAAAPLETDHEPESTKNTAWLDQIDTLIKTFWRPQALRRLLESIDRYYPAAHVTIADDGDLADADDAESRACCRLIEAHADWQLVTLPFESGVVRGRNALVDRATRPYLLFLDDDFCFTEETRIEKLFERLQNEPDLGVVSGACIDVLEGERIPRNSGGTLEIQGDTLLIDTRAWRDEARGLRDYVPQFALFRREVFSAIRWRGGLGAEHYDFCLQLAKSPWKVAQDQSVRIDHYPLTPTLPGYRERRLDCAAPQQWLLNSWNLERVIQDGETIIARRKQPQLFETTAEPGTPVRDNSYFEFSRPEVAALVPLSVRRILDIGCGAGRLGESLKQRQSAEVVGIELNPQAAALARARLDEVLEHNVESLGLDFLPGRFDCVICADVLEHLREPGKLLAKIRRWLTPDGSLVISLPNVRHHSVISGLMEGNWTYESAGLLDQDHVRFFTRRELEKLLYRCGFDLKRLERIPGPGDAAREKALQIGSVQVGGLQVHGLSADDANEFFTYQYVVAAQPIPRKAADQPAALAQLARDFPWPAEKPSVPVPTEHLGWFHPSSRDLLQKELNADTKLVVELGAWLGLSTRFIADQAPHAKIITIDHFQGGPEHRRRREWAALLPTLYETFLACNWEYRDRVIPLRMTTCEGLLALASYGLQPDLIFVDADHSYEAVQSDVALCRQLFPEARLVGDDYDDPDVRLAVNEQGTRDRLTVEPHGKGWRAWRMAPQPGPTYRRPQTEHGLTSIILVTHNEVAFTRECVDSLRARTDDPCELIFVDNGSTDGTVDYLQRLEGARVIFNPENRGFPAAVNQGLAIARGENIVLLNNDTVVTTGWLRRLLDVLHSQERIGLVGPCSNRVSGEQEVPAAYRDMASLDGFAWDFSRRHQGVVEETDRLVGFCLAIKRAVIDEIGALDERFGIGCYEDDDFCLRTLKAGWKAVIAREVFVHHYGSRTFQGSGVDFSGVLETNRKKFLEKWQGNEAVVSESSCNVAPSPAAYRNPQSEIRNPPVPAQCLALRASPHGLLLEQRPCRLSLCMIVRDNEATIGACLESIRPYVDEIVVVDTGSNDRTTDICREYGARLYEFPWCDDFAAARNESLRHARGEWIFWMDSDDTIPAECGRQLRDLVDGLHDPRNLGYILQVHCPGPAENGHQDVTVVDHVKLIRNSPDLRFEGRIHEQLLPAIRREGGEVGWTDIYVVHSGSDHSPASQERKLERDLRILHRELEERPQHPFVLFNLGMTYADAKRHEEAIEFLQQCLKASIPEESHLRKAYALLVSSLSHIDRNDEAWEICSQGLSLYPDDKELLFRSAILYHHFGRLKQAEEAYLRVMRDPEPRHFSSVDQGLAGYKARHNLALVYEDMGNFQACAHTWQDVLAEMPDYRPGWRGLAEALLQQGRVAEVRRLVDTLQARNEGPVEARLIQARLFEHKGRYAEARYELLAACHETSRDVEPLRRLCRLLFEQFTPEEAEPVLRKLTALDPENASAWHNLGVTQLRRGHSAEAATLFQRSLDLRPQSPTTIALWRQAKAACENTLLRV